MSPYGDSSPGAATASRPTARLAVIGAGLSGLACARMARDLGLFVRVFEKSRGLGGRLATRRPFGRDDPFGLDHGAPLAEASARRPETGAALQALATEADLATGLSSLVRPLVERPPALDVAFATEITDIAVGEEDYLLRDAEGGTHGPFDGVAVSAPAPQTRRLLGGACPESETEARYAPAAAVLAAFDPAPSSIPAMPPQGMPAPPLIGVWRMGAKPGRSLNGREGWVGHAAPDWSEAHLDTSKEAIAESLWPLLARSVGLDPNKRPDYLAGHRWRYGVVADPVGRADWLGPETSPAAGLGCCGDWRLGPKAGDALASGQALGRAMAARLSR